MRAYEVYEDIHKTEVLDAYLQRRGETVGAR
jgi:hypothetical protein